MKLPPILPDSIYFRKQKNKWVFDCYGCLLHRWWLCDLKDYGMRFVVASIAIAEWECYKDKATKMTQVNYINHIYICNVNIDKWSDWRDALLPKEKPAMAR